MKRGARLVTAFASLLVAAMPATPAVALEEPDRLWLVGERAAADGLHSLARRALEKLVDGHPRDARVPQAVFLLGQIRLAAGDAAGALTAFRRAQAFDPQPGRPNELKFWEAEALVRLKRYAEAAVAYDDVLRADAAAPFAPEAFYGYGWAELEQKRPEVAAKAFRDFLAAWPQHALAPSAMYHLARALVAQLRYEEAVATLQTFLSRHSGHKLAADALYLRGWARIAAGDIKPGIADLRAFSEANPAHPEAGGARRLIIETVVQQGGEQQDLIEAYRVLLAQTPASAEALFDAAGIAGKLGRARDQEVAWRKLRSTFPEHPLSRRVALELAASSYKKKEWRETVTHAQPATQSEDEAVRGEAFLLMGEAELKLRRFTTAARAFDSALEIESLDETLRYRALAGLGLAREELRDFNEAMSAYDQVANNSPDPALRDWAQERFTAVQKRLAKPEKNSSPPEKNSSPAEKKNSSPPEKKGRP